MSKGRLKTEFEKSQNSLIDKTIKVLNQVLFVYLQNGYNKLHRFTQ